MTLRTRLEALERARRAMQQAANSGVRRVPFINGRPDQAAVDALSAGRYILMPTECSDAEWQIESQRDQADLQRRAEVYFRSGAVPD